MSVASSTYEAQDVLKSPYDADLFDYYTTSQLALVDVASGEVTRIGKAAIFGQVDPRLEGVICWSNAFTVHTPTYAHMSGSLKRSKCGLRAVSWSKPWRVYR